MATQVLQATMQRVRECDRPYPVLTSERPPSAAWPGPFRPSFAPAR